MTDAARKVWPAALAFVAALPAAAQEVVGRSVVAGQPVELLSDNTWRPVDATASAPSRCRDLGQRVSFCGEGAGWISLPPSNPIVTAEYQRDSLGFAQFVVEPIGTEIGLTLEVMRNVVVSNASTAAGIPANQLEVLDAAPLQLDGIEAFTLAYRLEPAGLPVIFMNTFIVDEGRTVQMLTWELGPGYDEADRTLHQDLLDLVEIAP